ncbi:MAG: TIGR03790 family protein [Methylococcaceae bacterium]|nr:TIGR03790 family protein [Methylococcaceae bacterium]
MSINAGQTWGKRCAFALLGLFLHFAAMADDIHLELPKTGLAARELAIVVNENDPMSARIAEYYAQRRGIPNENILRVSFVAEGPNLSREAFRSVREAVLRQSGPQIQAYALAWTEPYRVDCMSITSAFALGFDEAYCSAKQCAPTKPSDYFNSASRAPYTDHRIRPAMLLAGRTFADVKRLIDRGVASDHTYPNRTGYLLNTSDRHRSVRAVFFENTVKALGEAFHLQRLDADSIKDKKDVLFYFTGSKRVEDLPSLHFLPGAIADHLTSAGGVLGGNGQMSSLRWLEAGATGSYGAVVEPCNHLQKFPLPAVAMWHYAEGNTLIEAYWKSVAWPGEGLFIGEPLARPFAPRRVEVGHNQALLKIFSAERKNLNLETSESPIGPYHTQATYPIRPGLNEVKIHLPEQRLHYRIVY